MSTAMGNQPPQLQLNQHSYPTRSSHGSVGPVIAVLAVITVLGIIAGMIGRLCSGRRVMGLGEYDLESWVETKCSSCVDGRIPPPPPPPPPPVEDVEAPEEEEGEEEEAPQEVKEEEEEGQGQEPESGQ